MRTPEEHNLLSQLSRLKWQAYSMGLHKALCTRDGCSPGVFMGLLTVGAGVSLTFLPASGTLPLVRLFALS